MALIRKGQEPFLSCRYFVSFILEEFTQIVLRGSAGTPVPQLSGTGLCHKRDVVLFGGQLYGLFLVKT